MRSNGRKTAHLSPSFVHLITQTLHVVDLGDVGGDDEDIGVAHDGSHLLARLSEHVLRDISECNLQARSKRRRGKLHDPQVV